MPSNGQTPDVSSCLHFVLKSFETTSGPLFPSWARGDPSEQEPIAIAVIGAKGSGKTSFVNIASGSNLRVRTNLGSGTTRIQLSHEFVLDGRRVTLIDTPGFDDNTLSDTDVLQMVATFLATTYTYRSKLAGIIYIHRISDGRLAEISSSNLKMFRQLCGDLTLKNVTLVTNMWGEVSRDAGEAREKKLIANHFKLALDKGALLTRHHNTSSSAYTTIRRTIGDRPYEFAEEEDNPPYTASSSGFEQEFEEHARHYQEEAGAWQEVITQIRREYEEMIRELQEEKDQIRRESMEEIRRFQQDVKMEMKQMASKYSEEKRRMEEVRQMQEEARMERERLLDCLNGCLRQCPRCR